MLNAMMSSHGK